ncbi:MAG TPA: UDP-N-acetylmuramate--L-alanine ligase [Gemmatimonadaceae bacterium]|nr:UDP-N-acetylmuramate--L-alanine ligase [Gemmatimonadaceae bacterium]
MPLIAPSDPRPVHFMGVAGAGMSALAALCARRGATVTGCDQSPDGAGDLARLGIAVSSGHDPAHLAGVRALVISSAIPKDHPEIGAAERAGIPVVRRAEALAEATAGGTLVAIAGTHGKSTTTVMTTEALKGAGVDATGVVGARVAAWRGNLSPGGDEVFVVEADEYDRSFLALSPDVAVVTNIETDHLDIYRDLTDIRGAFAQFVRGARWIVLCADDPYANLVPTPPSAEVVRYGIGSPDARLVARSIQTRDGHTSFDVRYDGKASSRVTLPAVGEHNVRNALAALAVGLAAWGLPAERMAEGLARCGGAERRFQRLGDARGITVVDDYAHHPSEIRATLSAARLAFPGRRIVVAFQPHLYSRTRDFAAEFGAALARADQLFLADIYAAREAPIVGVTSQLIADAMRPTGRLPAWQGARGDLALALAPVVKDGDVVVTMGAGDITRTGPELLALLGPGA